MSDEVGEKAVSERRGLGRYVHIGAWFVLGGLLGALGSFPFGMLERGFNSTVFMFAELTRSRSDILAPITRPGDGLVTSSPGDVQPGITLIQGTMPGGTQIRLIDIAGEELHRWNADFFEAWPDADDVFPANRVPKSRFNYFIQGMHPLRDGSIIMNFGDLGAIRLDACSNVVWRSDRPMHHSVTPTGDGRFWIPGHISVFDTPAEYLPRGYTAEDIQEMLTEDGYNNSLLLVTADGEVEREISVLESVFDAGLEHALYSSLQETASDPTHVNDIEIVTPELAARIDGVEEGDLLISIREMHMLAILDEHDGRLKWYQQGPWVRQHDPDITPAGMIDVFNNRSRLIGATVRDSQIVRLDPATGETVTLHPVAEDDRFYTRIMGEHQLLGNGNRLIIESLAGRVFETTPEGEVVWDYRLQYDDEYASLFSYAMRLPENYFEEEDWTCPPQAE
ncbi:arylsulfotransferase family protein [Parasphingopyxis sp.]|uniref:arylsulfotransferase family protein n=1 Tax=Parasphingopyxis sp. TaxID=1920299 RepID=UPI0026063AB4|nr:arylsulfotransferase family protein [Parasphingopyxis sp.]